jgi:hypothetical protein
VPTAPRPLTSTWRADDISDPPLLVLDCRPRGARENRLRDFHLVQPFLHVAVAQRFVVGAQDIAMGPVVPTMCQPLSSGTAS